MALSGENDRPELHKHLAVAKLGKDLADAGFRVFQIFFVLVVITYVWRRTGHWLGAVGIFLLGGILMLHLVNAPAAALLEFEKNHGDVKPWFQNVSWIGLFVAIAMLMNFMLVADPVVDAINDVIHPVGTPRDEFKAATVQTFGP